MRTFLSTLKDLLKENQIFFGTLQSNGMHNPVEQLIQKANLFLLVKNLWKNVIIKLVKMFYVYMLVIMKIQIYSLVSH